MFQVGHVRGTSNGLGQAYHTNGRNLYLNVHNVLLVLVMCPYHGYYVNVGSVSNVLVWFFSNLYDLFLTYMVSMRVDGLHARLVHSYVFSIYKGFFRRLYVLFYIISNGAMGRALRVKEGRGVRK